MPPPPPPPPQPPPSDARTSSHSWKEKRAEAQAAVRPVGVRCDRLLTYADVYSLDAAARSAGNASETVPGLRLLCFDFDNTLATIHLANSLAVRGNAIASAGLTQSRFTAVCADGTEQPHSAYTDWGELAAMYEGTVDAYREVYGQSGAAAIFGGPARIADLSAAFAELVGLGVAMYVITKGCAPLVEVALRDAGLLEFFAGITDFNPKVDVVAAIARTQFCERVSPAQAMLVDDDFSNFSGTSRASHEGLIASATPPYTEPGYFERLFTPWPQADAGRPSWLVNVTAFAEPAHCRCMLVGKAGVDAAGLATLVGLARGD